MSSILFCFCYFGFAPVCHCLWCGDQTQGLMSTLPIFYQLSYIPSPKYFFNNKVFFFFTFQLIHVYSFFKKKLLHLFTSLQVCIALKVEKKTRLGHAGSIVKHLLA